MTISNLKRQCSERNACSLGILLCSLVSSLNTGMVTLTKFSKGGCVCCQSRSRLCWAGPVGKLHTVGGKEIVRLFTDIS